MERGLTDAHHEEGPGTCKPEGMSKNQWKKKLKQQRIEQGRAEWKKRKKEKDREKRQRRREEEIARPPPAKKQKMSDATASQVRVAIELGYQDLMTDMDIHSLLKQCQRCYAANRRAASPLQLYFTSFGGRFKERMQEAVQGYTKWDVHFKSGDYVEEFGGENIIYLVAESPNILKELAPNKVYVIGGLVDHNHHKGHCYQSALSKGVAHAQLPISEYIALNSRKVLAVNHVFEILVAFVQHGDWKIAFQEVIPHRKQSSQTAKSPSPSCSTLSPQSACVNITETKTVHATADGSGDSNTDTSTTAGSVPANVSSAAEHTQPDLAQFTSDVCQKDCLRCSSDPSKSRAVALQSTDQSN